MYENTEAVLLQCVQEENTSIFTPIDYFSTNKFNNRSAFM